VNARGEGIVIWHERSRGRCNGRLRRPFREPGIDCTRPQRHLWAIAEVTWQLPCSFYDRAKRLVVRRPRYGTGDSDGLLARVRWLAGGVALTAAIASLWVPPVRALDFDGTVWSDVAGEVGVDPGLLYALALTESGRELGEQGHSPWPWVIRTPSGGYWFDSRAAARRGLEAVRAEWPADRVDVGAAQINLGWHRHRFGDPAKLLDLRHNLRIAARILADSVASTRDPVLGIGRYHHWQDRERSRSYGQRVWGKYRRITLPGHEPRVDYLVASADRLSALVQRLARR